MAASTLGSVLLCLAAVVAAANDATLSGGSALAVETREPADDCHTDGTCADEEDHAPALVEFLQMGLSISGVAPAAEAAEVNKSMPPKLSMEKALPDCSSLPFGGAQPTPLNLQSMNSVLNYYGYESRFRACEHIVPSGVTYKLRNATRESAVPVAGTTKKNGILSKIPLALWAIVLYIVVAAGLLLHMIWTISRSTGVTQPKNTNFRPESEAYRTGLLSWLCISWATPWICRFGNMADASKTKIKPSDLGQSGWADHEAANSHADFIKIWDEDIAKRGTEAYCNMYWVIFKFCTPRKVIQLALMTFMFEILMFLGPTFCVDWTLTYMQKMQVRQATNPTELSLRSELPVILAMVGMFTGMPLMMTMSNTVAMLLGSRLAIRLQSACIAAVFKKAQRMPLAGGHYDLRNKEEEEITKTGGGGGSEDSQSKNYSLVQLVNTDINGSLMSFQFIIAKLIITFPILAGLTTLMFVKLGKSALIPMGVVIGMTNIVWFIVRQQIIRFRWYQVIVGGKLSFFQEIMHAIRMIKTNAYEPAVSQILRDARKQELTQLGWVFFWMGVDIAVITIYPKVVIVSGLAGFDAIRHGDIQPADIFVMMQILGAFKGCAQGFLSMLPAVVGFAPSIQRIDKMLKMKETVLAGDKTELSGVSWLSVWPKEDPKKPLALANEIKPCLRVQGTYLWSEGSSVALSDLDVTVQQGELVAVMGEVGSGKSTLLAALLGELHPTKDSRLEIPERIAYHSQVPVICEATLRENVLYWTDMEDKNYQEALRAACLLPDLEIMPGGDMVTIGSRGISLSGGQRARVSLARAAYATYAPVVLMDDPFASVDAPTGRHLMDNLLLGPLMKDRARVVVCQPDRQRVKAFDRIFIMSGGRVTITGTPEEVISTPQYQALLSKLEASQLQEDIDAGLASIQTGGNSGFQRTPNADPGRKTQSKAIELREEEHEGRADWSTLRFYFSMGGYGLMLGTFVFYILSGVFALFSDLVFVRWSNRLMQSAVLGISSPDSGLYLRGTFVWCGIGIGFFVLHWLCGVRWSLRISAELYEKVLQRLMRAPVDRFYDKTPIGRIMNRMSFDMTSLDMALYVKLQGVISSVIGYVIPLIYVHYVMPIYLLIGSVPFYCLLYILVSRYWSTMVPLRYLNSTSRSHLNSYLTEVENGSVCSRAYQVSDLIAQREMVATDDLIKVEWANTCISRWTCNRVLLTYSIFGTIVAVMGVFVLQGHHAGSVGTMGLCLSHISVLIMGSEGFLNMLTETQFQFISMNRLQEYSELPEERAPMQATDGKYYSPVVNIQRATIGSCEVRCQGTRLQILRKTGPNGETEVLLEQMPGAQAFQPPVGKSMASLDPTNHFLHGTTDWHRVYAVNGISKDAAAMAEEFCHGEMSSVWLSIRSGWLVGGACVVMTDLVVGYADIPSDVLRGVTLTIEAKSKTAIAGATGCGKSTTILAILRMLEPRGGNVKINGVNLQDIGLFTLRNSMGLVPQDPVLFTGTIRNNLDPFSVYTDKEVWDSLRAVQMADFVKKEGIGLDMYVKADGDNLSFGQKQLMCIARQILRNPELLLLDECTSAIDPKTQELVQDTIRSGFPDATVVAIAHRLETIMDFDTVIVLDKGRVVEKGAISDLQNASGGWFAKMLHAKDC